jgi:uncharacterized protein (TIGR02145 family)
MVVSIFSGCKKEKTPSVTTTSVSNITGSDATSGGNITDEGSSAIISRGVSWSTGTSPTIADYKTTDGTGTGSFSSIITGLDGDMVYNVRAYATNSIGTAYGEVVSFTSFGQSPTVTTAAATNVNATIAKLNGIVNANELSTIVTFEYGTTSSYGSSAIATQSPVMGDTTLTVSANITGLTVGTVYHYRVKSVNALGTTFGSDLTFLTVLTDVEGNAYKTVTIGTQEWMQENLKTTRYRNGELIGTTYSVTADISGEINPEYQWASNVVKNGRYYTFYAINDSRSVCPEGWHVPTDAELITLTDYLSGNGYGFKGKEQYIAKSLAATSGWVPDTTAGNVGNDQKSNNSSGFTAVSGGGRYSDGVVNFVGYHSIWWSSTESSSTGAYFRCVGYIPGQVFKGVFNKSYGLPVRCLQDY